MNLKYLNSLTAANTIKDIKLSELPGLCAEIRSFLIDSVSKTGGHIGANLGVIEVTVAMHYALNIGRDKLVFDTGHIGYTHKILTGRLKDFARLNIEDGMSRFLERRESEYDIIDASHAGTAISIAAGLNFKKEDQEALIVAISGDGALVEGMGFEGLNYAPLAGKNFIVVVNDNGMAIPKNVGGVSNLFSGSDWETKSKNYFEGLGFQHVAAPDGHDVQSLVAKFENAKKLAANGPVLFHVKTNKGHGLELAKNHPYKLHFSMPFNPVTGQGTSPVPPGKTYAVVAGDELLALLKAEPNLFVITPSTPYASGIEECMRAFPDRVIDVGMAEQHAVGMAVGLALQGKKVVVCFQSTFMQRAFDQLIHDVAYMNLPITILSARSGFAGLDSSTHHGIFDISYLRTVPGLRIFYPGSSHDLRSMLRARVSGATEPMVILHAYEKVRDNDDELKGENIFSPEIVKAGKDGAFLSVGNTLDSVYQAVKFLKTEYDLDFGICNIRHIKPLPVEFLLEFFKQNKLVITTEENVLAGGFGSAILEFANEYKVDSCIKISGIPCRFIKAGDKKNLEVLTGIDSRSLARMAHETFANA